MAISIDNSDDIIDSRDVESRIDDLPDELKDEYGEYCKACEDDEQPVSFKDWLEGAVNDSHSEALEYTALLHLAEQGRGYGDWEHGETLIRKDYFPKYAEQFAEDIGAIDKDARWPNDCIDWEKAASELEMDYTSLDFDGEEYLMRS